MAGDDTKSKTMLSGAKAFLDGQAAQDAATLKLTTTVVAASEVFFEFSRAVFRIMRYQRITRDALGTHKQQGYEFDGEISTAALIKLANVVNRKFDVEFLEGEKEHADSHVIGQAVIAMYSALEVFVGDFVQRVLEADPSRIKNVSPKLKLGVVEFYEMDEARRIARIVDLVSNESKLGLGCGVFEPVLDAFKLGGMIEDLTRRDILEFAAVRNCLVHRKGVVDQRFLEGCGTTKLKLGEEILLTSGDIDRYFFASLQYASTVCDRITGPAGSLSESLLAELVKLHHDSKA